MLTIGWSTLAQAQSTNKVALGMAYSMRGAPDDGTSAFTRPSFLWRFGEGHTGWGWRYGLNWYSTQLAEPTLDGDTTGSAGAVGDAGALETFGRMRLRPILVGYGYHHKFGSRTTVGAGATAGYAFVSFDMTQRFEDAYRNQLGANSVSAEASNTFAARPEVSVWIDLSRKIGLNIASAYIFARPDVTITSSLGRDTRPINADVFQFRIGAVYSVF